MFRCKSIILPVALALVTFLVLIAGSGCNFPLQVTATETMSGNVEQVLVFLTPAFTETEPQEPLQENTDTPTLSLKPAPAQTAVSTAALSTPDPACDQDVCIEPGTFILSRPIGSDGRNTVDPSNRFGEYRSATGYANHGAAFLNSSGTPVLAAADGVVLVAGDDSSSAYARRTGTYGNLVVLEHTLPGIGKTVYTLYGHLSSIAVSPGDRVKVGQDIGQVGMTGRISGSTLHFEVRFGENHFQEARNPELLMELLPDEDGQLTGALAGRILDADGNTLQVNNIQIERLAGPDQFALDTIYLKTYASDHLAGKSPWRENFAVGELPAGNYQISFYHDNVLFQKEVEIEPGKLTVVKFPVE
jgi:murein DD-endopeptidase MepM/ murein hydrolase activator NlpD